MIHKLRVICPTFVVCLAVMVFCVFGMDSKAASVPSGEESATAVTYTADAWSDGGMAEPTAAKPERLEPTDSPSDTDTVPAQAHRDSGYQLQDEERVMVERIVMCEAGGEGEKGQMMVAQCILEGMLRYHYSIDEYIDNYKVMITSYDNVTDEVRNSVSRVFDNGERVIPDKVDLWYNPAITPSDWHEEQQYVITVGSHRFFWMIDNNNT